MPKERILSLLQSFRNIYHIESWVGFFVGLLIFLSTLIFNPPSSMTIEAWHCLGMALLMAIWWSTEAIPIPATALLPIILIPALDLGNIRSATAPYANPTIYLFLGGFLLGLAMEKCNLHKRIALNILHSVGSSPNRQVAGFMIATAFLSMWVSNTATTVIMTPIGISVAAMVTAGHKTKDDKRFEVALLLSIAYAANIGGIATLIGTPPNALLRAFLEEHYQIQVGFAQWMLLGVPVATILLLFTYWWMIRVPFAVSGSSPTEGGALIKNEIKKLGAFSGAERMVAIIFIIAALGWITRPLLSHYIPFLSDTFIAMAASMTLFLIPSNAAKREFLIDWEHASHIPWGILILFGGGLSLANVINSSTLAQWLANQLNVFSGVHLIIMIVIITTSISALTTVTSNTTTAAAFLPLVGAMAVAQGVDPQYYTIPAALAASCAFILPVSTPPNAIVFSSGLIPISAMMKTGLTLNIFSIAAITVIVAALVRIIF